MNWDLVRTRLKALIDEKGWSHNTLADNCGVPQPTISRFMSGDGGMTLDNLSPICTALDVTIGQIIGELPLEPDAATRRTIKAMQELPDYKREAVATTAESLLKSEKKAVNGG